MFYGECLSLANEKRFAAFLRTLFREDWVVYAKPPFGGPEHVLQYLARYTHRVAISNHRLVGRQRVSRQLPLEGLRASQQARIMTLTLEEFLRRFLQHVLPKGFPRIRYFGWLANRRRANCFRAAAFYSRRVCKRRLQLPLTTPPSGCAPIARGQ